MLLQFGTIFSISKKASFIFCLLFFINTSRAQGQPPTKDPSNPESLPTQLPPAQLYDFLKDKNGENSNNKSIGSDKNKSLKEKIEKDSLVKESTPQSVNSTEETYGMNLFRGGVVASITELSTPPLDYPIGVYDHIIVSLWNGAEATLEYTVARDGSIFPTGLGKIYIQGLTFENVRSLLSRRFKSYVPPT